jgi:hypothetical protein
VLTLTGSAHGSDQPWRDLLHWEAARLAFSAGATSDVLRSLIRTIRRTRSRARASASVS